MKAMEIVKKNLVSVLCGVLAIAAVVAWFWPIGGMFESLQASVDQSKKTYEDVEALRRAERKLPSLVLENSEQDILNRFPNERVIKVGQDATGKLKAQSDLMIETVTKLNKREPLVPGSLPRANSQASSLFPDAYLTALGQTEQGWKTGLPALLKAAEPPTREEIELVAEEIWNKKYKVRIYQVGTSDNSADVGAEFEAEVLGLPDAERKKRALENIIYLDGDSIPPSTFIELGKQPRDDSIWYAQTGLWIAEDVVAAINSANKDAKNILDAPVKHLVSLRVPFGPDQYVLPTAAPGMAGTEGGPIMPTPNANGVFEVFSVSPTGRVCNDIYDVIHFDLVLRVDYRKIPQILAELERNRLFTVLKTGVAAIDSNEEYKANGYVYGKDPVAELSIQCEALFLRSWTVDKENDFAKALMPDDVQRVVGAKPGGAGMPGIPMPSMETMDGEI